MDPVHAALAWASVAPVKPTWVLLVAALLSACSSGTDGPGPGSTPAGAACDGPQDCGCWTCECTGIDGDGAAQLCTDGKCPTGEEACAQDCALAHAKVAKATAVDHCPGTLDAGVSPQ